VLIMSKKPAEQKPRPILGRFSHNLKIGIVGLPNVGKSTFFNTLTQMNVPAENYPFCTIEPNEARVAVPDERFDWLCNYWKPPSKVQAFLQIWDIAGLVKGAHEGQGLGNAFLSHIQAVDGIFHMVRIFEDPEVTHVEGSVDPIRDMQIINEELLLKDMERVNSLVEDLELKVKRAGKLGPKEQQNELAVLQRVQVLVRDEKKPVRGGDWNNAEIEILNRHLFLTAKPVIYLVNMTEPDFIKKKSKWLPKIKAAVDEYEGPGVVIIPFSAGLEAKLLNGEVVKDGETVITSTLPKIIKTGYSALNLIYFFTAGEKEVKCWTIRKGTLAPQAAGTIHTDFEKGFICAELMKFDDLKAAGSEAAVKDGGKYKRKGKDYPMEDGDIVEFKFNAPTSGKK
jgi:obg-like ATPase 1